MSQSSKKQLIGFPPPLLGMRPVRLRILMDDGEFLCLEKPEQILVLQDNWYPNLPVLAEAIRYQASQGKPELQKLGIGQDGLWSLYTIDPEIAGPVLFTRSRSFREELKNALGADQFEFTFHFVSKGEPGDGPIDCDLPIARHTHRKHMLVSHTSGKKCATRFEKVDSIGRGYHMWQAKTSFPRLHQIQLHAFELGFRIVGDTIYSGSPSPLLSSLKKDYRPSRHKEEQPMLNGPCLFLNAIARNGEVIAAMPPPGKIAGFIKQLRRL